jgi:hypothetical protein
MGDFSEWYSTFLTDLPGGGVPTHTKHETLEAKRDVVHAPRLKTADYQSFIRDMHRIESMERKKMQSLPELCRSPSPTRAERKTRETLSTMSRSSLPMIVPEQGLTGQQSLKKCETFLQRCLNPKKRRQTAQILVLDGLGDVYDRRTPDHHCPDGKKMFVPKYVGHPEIVTDDLVRWQRGLLENVNGRAVLKQESIREYEKDCIDVGLTLEKAKRIVKLLDVRDKMIGKTEEVKRQVKEAVEMGRIDSVDRRFAEHQAPDFVFENRRETMSQRKDYRRAMLVQAASKRAKKQLLVHEKSMIQEEQWKQEVEQKLIDRQERQHRRILQTKWLPGSCDSICPFIPALTSVPLECAFVFPNENV